MMETRRLQGGCSSIRTSEKYAHTSMDDGRLQMTDMDNDLHSKEMQFSEMAGTICVAVKLNLYVCIWNN
jgi:hypothetical protein